MTLPRFQDWSAMSINDEQDDIMLGDLNYTLFTRAGIPQEFYTSGFSSGAAGSG